MNSSSHIRSMTTWASLLACFIAVHLIAYGRSFAADSPTAASAGRSARTWKDRTGKFNVEATFVETRDGKVILKRGDGTTIAVPLSRLSDEDQKFVHGLEET